MIGRRARIRELAQRRYTDGSTSHHASILADGVELTLLLTSAEYDAASHALAKGAHLILRLSEEAVT